MARRIKRASIDFISLVPRGANRLPVIYKSEDGAVEFDTILKIGEDFDEQGELTAVVYAPESRDSQGDIASAKVIKEMAHNFSKTGKGVDIRHDGKVLTKDKAFVAETFIIAKGDERFSDIKDYDGNPVDVTGGWGAVLKIEDPELRKEYRDGKWNGVSMGGVAEVEAEKSGDGIIAALKELLGLTKGHRADDNGELDMTEADLKKILDERDKNLVAEITKALKPEPVKKDGGEGDDKDKETAPVFKGDWSDEKVVRKHQRDLAIFEARKEHDATTAEGFAALGKAIAEINKEFAEDTDDGEKPVEKSDEVKQLEADLAKARKRSNQTSTNKEGDGGNETVGISKEDNSLLAEGAKQFRLLQGIKD